MKKKTVALLLACVLIVGCVIGGSLAWLTDQSDKVQNVFTTSDININLTESEGLDLKMIPGHTIKKDPVVTVEKDSEDCYVFIKVDALNDVDNYLDWAVDSASWTQLTDKDGKEIEGVYYLVARDVVDDKTIKVIGWGSHKEETWVPNQVHVKETVTKDMMKSLTAATYPTLTFTAYATQYWKTNDEPFGVFEAWQQTTYYKENNP